jgi:hypothetical protein
MAHDHGSEYQVRVIHQDGTEALSEWMEHGRVAQAMACLQKPQAVGYWLRERNIIIAACPHCRGIEGAVAEYPLSAALSSRSRPHDNNILPERETKSFQTMQERKAPMDRYRTVNSD